MNTTDTLTEQNLLTQKTAKFNEPDKIRALGVYPYFRPISSEQDTEVTIQGKRVLMFGSNSYLGLTNHPKVKEASIAAIQKYGTGNAGSPFLNGTLDIHVELAEKLARFVGKEDAILYSTGFQVNMGVIPSLAGREDYLIYDELDHASIMSGKQLSFAKLLKFKHNDMESLEKMLQKCEPDKVKLIIVDGIFSMEGDMINLPQVVALAKEYNASVYVDEAHSFGVLGRNGRGICDHYGLSQDVDVIMGTFSKSLASIGGFVAADHSVIDWLRHNSRSYIFSASPTPSATAAALAALEIMQDELERIENLWKITNYALDQFRSLGFEIGNTETPIIPLFIRDNEKTFMFTRMAFDKGVFINPVVSPAVPSADTLIRFSLMATHTIEQVDIAITKLAKVARNLGII
ncbi:MAG: pyridoxal phosphate-dependent aminotransferase family protein [Prevotellaceae bacterium]|nr:pyridoxal phosphate-dependent aminotransferase family protein [Prevotellaceae bacterium]